MSIPATKPLQTKGRGARTNASGRYEPVVHEAFDDGWTADRLPTTSNASPSALRVIRV